MKVLNLLTGALLVLVAGSASAALPPYQERLREIKLVLDNEALEARLNESKYEKLASGFVDAIGERTEKNNNVTYTVSSGLCKAQVTLTNVTRPGLIGPPEYDLFVAKKLICEKP